MNKKEVLRIFKENEIRIVLDEEEIEEGISFAINANSNGNYINWFIKDDIITLDGEFTIEVLEALIWYMKNIEGE